MEQDKNKLEVYFFKVTSKKTNEDGSVSEEREDAGAVYAFEGAPSPEEIDYGKYWEHGNGCLSLVAEDGCAIESCVETALEFMYDLGFRNHRMMPDARNISSVLDAPGKWLEISLDDKLCTTVRITRLPKLPAVDRALTRKGSDLSVTQQWCVKINGIPLFREGGTVYGNAHTRTTVVFRPNLERELSKVWEEVIASRKDGLKVHVSVSPSNDFSADRLLRHLRIEAGTREELAMALSAVGVLRPEEVEPDMVVGEDGTPVKFVSVVQLADRVD